jgi:hypothetical protein
MRDRAGHHATLMFDAILALPLAAVSSGKGKAVIGTQW